MRRSTPRVSRPSRLRAVLVRPGFRLVLLSSLLASSASAQSVVVFGKKVYTMAGPPLENATVLIINGKIEAVGSGPLRAIVPEGTRRLEAAVVVPGLIDAHSTVGLSGIFNHPHDQDQLERSAPVQPELRAVDAYNPKEKLVEWVRGFGVTTLHTGHGPGELISGQTFIVKTAGNTVEDALVVDQAAIAVTLSEEARRGDPMGADKGGKSPGTRGKMMAMLRQEFIKTQEYLRKREKAEEDKKPDRDLKYEALGRVLRKEIPLLVTAHKAQDIANALRAAREFDVRVILDGAAESYLMLEEIKSAGVPVILHPTMMRAYREMENMSFETAAKLAEAGIPLAIQSGFEGYVPKTRVVLFEAAITAANGRTFDEALASITIDAARILGVDKRLGSLEVGKDGDLALYDGDPFEYTTHCTATIVNGRIVHEGKR